MSAGERFAAVPERFTEALRARQITWRQYALGVYLLGTADHRSWELTRTLEQLSAESAFPMTRDSLSRDLRALESGGWIRCEIGVGQSLWRIKITGLRRRTSAEPPQTLRKEKADSAEVPSASELYAGAGVPHGSKVLYDLEPPHAATALDVDVDVDNPPNPPSGGNMGLRKRTNYERRIARFGRKLSGEQLASFQSLTPDARAQVVERHAASTGLRRARGSGGASYKNDVLGDYPLPTGSEALQLPPDYAGKAMPADFFRAWLKDAGKP